MKLMTCGLLTPDYCRVVIQHEQFHGASALEVETPNLIRAAARTRAPLGTYLSMALNDLCIDSAARLLDLPTTTALAAKAAIAQAAA